MDRNITEYSVVSFTLKNLSVIHFRVCNLFYEPCTLIWGCAVFLLSAIKTLLINWFVVSAVGFFQTEMWQLFWGHYPASNFTTDMNPGSLGPLALPVMTWFLGFLLDGGIIFPCIQCITWLSSGFSPFDGSSHTQLWIVPTCIPTDQIKSSKVHSSPMWHWNFKYCRAYTFDK